jgi:hypothetical protein
MNRSRANPPRALSAWLSVPSPPLPGAALHGRPSRGPGARLAAAAIAAAFAVAVQVTPAQPASAQPAPAQAAPAQVAPAQAAPAQAAPAQVAATDSATATKQRAPEGAAAGARDGGQVHIRVESKPGAKADGSIAVERDSKRRVAIVGVEGIDGEYDSFGDLVDKDPWLAVLIFGTVALVFLAPVVLVVGAFWYKLRRTRMQNELLMKLAEHGIPPSALVTAAQGPGVNEAHPAAPAMRALRDAAADIGKRGRSSDLRKGALFAAVGLGITAASSADGDGPSGLGLVLLFVGLAYLALWWFEERSLGRTTENAPRNP